MGRGWTAGFSWQGATPMPPSCTDPVRTMNVRSTGFLGRDHQLTDVAGEVVKGILA